MKQRLALTLGLLGFSLALTAFWVCYGVETLWTPGLMLAGGMVLGGVGYVLSPPQY